MLKAFCDICGEETNNQEFYCEMNVVETVYQPVSLGQPISPKKEMQKKSLHICQKCYSDNIAKLLK